MSGLMIGDAVGFTDEQDLTARRDASAAVGIAPVQIDVDHGPTRARPPMVAVTPAERGS